MIIKRQPQKRILLNIFTGYTHSFNHIILGADISLNYEKFFRLLHIRSLGLSLNPCIGYKFDETTAGYFKLGLGYSKINLSKESKDLGFKPDMFSVTPAFGVEKFFSENVSVRGEVGYKFKKIDYKKDLDGHIIYKKTIKNALVTTVGLSYTF